MYHLRREHIANISPFFLVASSYSQIQKDLNTSFLFLSHLNLISPLPRVSLVKTSSILCFSQYSAQNRRTTSDDNEQEPDDNEQEPDDNNDELWHSISLEDTMLKKLKGDLKKLPEDQGLDEFKYVPVEGFGATLLARYGWSEGMGIGKNAKEDVKVVEYMPRIAKEGLGFVMN